MANKINQITVGDILVIQVDNNPRATGLQAPLGSIAIWQDSSVSGGRAYIKIGNGVNSWNDLHYSWQYQGNTLGAVAFGVLGSVTGIDKDIQFIRNGNEMMRMTKDLSTSEVDSPQLSFLSGKAFFGYHSNLNTERLNKTFFLSNEHLTIPTSKTELESIAIYSQGYAGLYSIRGTIRGNDNFDRSDVNKTGLKSIHEYGANLLNHTFTGAPVTLDLDNLEIQAPTMIKVNLDIMIKNSTSGVIYQQEKTFALKCTDYSLKQYSVLFSQDNFTFSEDGIIYPTANLVMANDSDTTAGGDLLNTYKLNCVISDLDIGQQYDIVVFSKRLGYEFI